MKKPMLFAILGLVIVIAIAIGTAGKMGDTSKAHARGKVVLDDSLRDAAKDIKTLYLIVGHTETPMPFGALRKGLSDPPQGEVYEFVLTTDRVQRMREDLPWPDPFKLKARLDRDGAAGPDQPGDLVGEIASVKDGSEGLVVRIDRVVE